MELRFLAYNLVQWYAHHVLQEDDCLAEMRVFELVGSVGSRAVVVERMAEATWVIYLANAPTAVRQVVTCTQVWLRHSAEVPLVLRGGLRRIQYDLQTLVDAVWLAGQRLGGLPPPALCKT